MADCGTEFTFDRLFNFRQAGGTQVGTNKDKASLKSGLLYRSARTDFMTDNDKSSFLQLGIKSIVDIRGERQYRKNSFKPLQSHYTPCVIKDSQRHLIKGRNNTAVGFHYLFDMYTRSLREKIFCQVNFFIRLFSVIVLVPLDRILGTHFMIQLYGRLVIRHQSLFTQYMDLLEHGKPIIAQIIKLLLNPEENLPMLIHCAYGKDRTGLIVALILACVGIEDDVIIKDYAQSEEGLSGMKDQLYYEIVNDWGVSEWNCLSKPETMSQVLHELRKRYGSVNEYLKSIGISTQDQDQLKSILIDSF